MISPYDTEGKATARRIVVDLACESHAASILDLWGGGRSARAFRAALPAAIVTSAEADETQWAALRLDAQQNGYAYHFGNVGTVEGKFDFVWLDLCGQASPKMASVIRKVLPHLIGGGMLALTVLPARESDPLFAGDQRLMAIPQWLEGVSQMHVRMLFPYTRAGGQSMYLVVLRERMRNGSWFSGDYFERFVRPDINDDGIWSHALDFSRELSKELWPTG